MTELKYNNKKSKIETSFGNRLKIVTDQIEALKIEYFNLEQERDVKLKELEDYYFAFNQLAVLDAIVKKGEPKDVN